MAGSNGKGTKGPQTTTGIEDEADVEGHMMLQNPILNRELARAREAEIQRSLRAREHQLEAKRPHKK